jgi:hypothetical protein
MSCNLGGCHGIGRECCMADNCIYCDEYCGGGKPKSTMSEKWKDQVHIEQLKASLESPLASEPEKIIYTADKPFRDLEKANPEPEWPATTQAEIEKALSKPTTPVGSQVAGEKLTEHQILEAIRKWKYFWMNQTQNSEADRANYFHRAFGVDSNMAHDLAHRIHKLLTIQEQTNEGET